MSLNAMFAIEGLKNNTPTVWNGKTITSVTIRALEH
jgi:hypothetical protein